MKRHAMEMVLSTFRTFKYLYALNAGLKAPVATNNLGLLKSS